ncbi:es1 protein mitochondrial-like [Limosa lapponica baueri]|uniref:Es1 protein mitochondrial-like n=1 Tax=Limosa lapponica baueri TaxID=1758121 RepID=A0A2I0TEL4_LIMLA|nr:es1 protein mitochondrial-like [Limosa lapponica baueri]
MGKRVAVVLAGCGVYDGSEIHEASAVLVHLSREGAQERAGGFGVAKNLSTWATQGKNCIVCKEVEDVLKAFHAAKKPIGLCCISPVLAAKIFPGCELTVGHDTECEKWPYAKTAETMKELGCTHVNKHVTEIHVDAKNKLVTTSAFMCNAPIHEIYDGIGKMVKEVVRLA